MALQNFFITRGYLTEGRELMRAALTLPAVLASDLARAHTLYAAAALAVMQGDPREAREQLLTCLALRRTAGDRLGTAQTLSTLAMAQLAAGDAAAALPAEQEALALFRELGDGVAEAIVQLQLGHVLIGLERWAEAVAHLRESLALARRLANREVAVITHNAPGGQPVLVSVLNPKDEPLPQPTVRQASKIATSIRSFVSFDPALHRFDLERLWGYAR